MRAIAAAMRNAFAEALANRGALWTQVVAMIVNDIVWVVFWVLFFDEVGHIRGWDASRVLLLFAVLTTSAGLVMGFLANTRRVGRYAANGELDAVLALPVPPLAYLLVRRVETANLGDFVFGIGLFAVAGDPTPARAGMFALVVLASAALFAGFLVATGSLAFFVGRGEAGDFGFQAMLLLASYPADIFTGATKALLYTVLPAAFVSAVPARLIDEFDAGSAASLVGVAGAFAITGWALFTLGLRRYTSGAVWTRA